MNSATWLGRSIYSVRKRYTPLGYHHQELNVVKINKDVGGNAQKMKWICPLHYHFLDDKVSDTHIYISKSHDLDMKSSPKAS